MGVLFSNSEDYSSWCDVMARLRSKLSKNDSPTATEKVSLKRAARLAMVLTLSACFAVHIWNWVFKCLDRDTIMVLRTNQVRNHRLLHHMDGPQFSSFIIMIQDTDMRLPTVALCPSVGHGFVESSMTSLGLHEHQWAAHEKSGILQDDWKRPFNRSQVDIWHKQSTHAFHEVVSKVTFHMGKDGRVIQLYPMNPDGILDGVTMTEMESLHYGRCFLLSVNFAIVNPVDFMDIYLLFPRGIESYQVLSFEKGLEVPGIGLDSWSGPVHQNTLERDARHFLTLTKRSYYLDPKNSYCHDHVSRADSVNCLVDKSKILLSGDIFGKNCYWPGLGAFADENDPVCGSPDEVRSMALSAERALMQLVGKRQCLPNCRVDVVDDKWRVVKKLIKDEVRAFLLSYKSTTFYNI